MFAYCNNNPVNGCDPSGESAFDLYSEYQFCSAGGYVPIDLTEDVKTLGIFLLGLIGISEVNQAAKETSADRKSRSYIVYLLADQQGNYRYVGRVTTSGYEARMNYHRHTRGLSPIKTFTGLSYYEARGLEETLMVELHLLDPSNPLNNQIHGIGSRNSKGTDYLAAAQEYLINHVEDYFLNLFC